VDELGGLLGAELEVQGLLEEAGQVSSALSAASPSR
jgi:hypothetical protein